MRERNKVNLWSEASRREDVLMAECTHRPESARLSWQLAAAMEVAVVILLERACPLLKALWSYFVGAALCPRVCLRAGIYGQAAAAAAVQLLCTAN